jgi:hypothetical protein
MVKINDRAQPIAGDKTTVNIGEITSEVSIVNFQNIEINSDGLRGDNIFDSVSLFKGFGGKNFRIIDQWGSRW